MAEIATASISLFLEKVNFEHALKVEMRIEMRKVPSTVVLFRSLVGLIIHKRKLDAPLAILEQS